GWGSRRSGSPHCSPPCWWWCWRSPLGWSTCRWSRDRPWLLLRNRSTPAPTPSTVPAETSSLPMGTSWPPRYRPTRSDRQTTRDDARPIWGGQPEKRQSALLAALLVVVLAITARLVYVQMVAGPSLAAAAEQEYTRSYTEHGARGDIVDADGNILATSVQTYQIVVDQRFVPEYRARDDEGEVVGYGAAAAAERLAPLLDA